MSEWISVKDRLPEHLQEVLTVDQHGNFHLLPILREVYSHSISTRSIPVFICQPTGCPCLNPLEMRVVMRPIDATVYSDHLAWMLKYGSYQTNADALLDAKFRLTQMHTLTIDDLRPKGRWNIVEFDKAANRVTIECSNCGMVEEMSLTAYGLGHNSCHSCGADMQGGAND